MTQRGRKINDYFFDHQEEFISLLRSLVEEETPSHDPPAFEGAFQILSREFEQLNFVVDHLQGRESAGQLLIQPKDFDPEDQIQLIIGHCDTVWETGTLQEMPYTVEDNVITGPGVYDMKAGICMMIFALRAIRALNKKVDLQPVFIITTDEEVGSGESREVLVEWAQRAERTYVLEPSLGTEGKIKTQRKGVGNFEMTLTGKPSHAGLAPEKGVSAILGLSHLVQQLFQLNDASRGISVNVGTIEGGERSNVIAAKSKAVIDVRVLTKEDGEQVTDSIYNLEPDLKGIDLDVEGEIYRPPMEKNEANRDLWKATRDLGDELGLDLQEGISGGASDGNFTSQYSATIDGLGAVGEGAHAWHEKIFLKETLKRTALFTLLLLEPSIGKE